MREQPKFDSTKSFNTTLTAIGGMINGFVVSKHIISVLIVAFWLCKCCVLGVVANVSRLAHSALMDVEWNSTNQYIEMAARQKHFVIGVKRINKALWNPSMIINPHNESQVIFVWRIKGKKRQDNTGYFLLDFPTFDRISNVPRDTIGKLVK